MGGVRGREAGYALVEWFQGGAVEPVCVGFVAGAVSGLSVCFRGFVEGPFPEDVVVGVLTTGLGVKPGCEAVGTSMGEEVVPAEVESCEEEGGVAEFFPGFYGTGCYGAHGGKMESRGGSRAGFSGLVAGYQVLFSGVFLADGKGRAGVVVEGTGAKGHGYGYSGGEVTHVELGPEAGVGGEYHVGFESGFVKDCHGGWESPEQVAGAVLM